MRKLVVMAALLAAGAVRAADRPSDSQQQPGDKTQTTAQEPGKSAQEQERDRMKKDAFDVKGQVSKVSSNALTVSRKDAPAATLHVDPATKVELDGKQASLSELKPGQDVKASFNLKGDKPTAIEIKAEKMKSEKGGTPGTTAPSTAPSPAPSTPSNK